MVRKFASRYLDKWLIYYIKHVKNRHFDVISGLYRDFPNCIFLTDFYASKSVLGSFFAFFVKTDLKTCITALNPDFLDCLFYLVTWDNLALCYGHKAQEMIFTNVRDTIHADSLALFELDIETLLADVTKPEKSNIPAVTWPVTSLETPRSLKFIFLRQFFQGRLNF